MVSFAQKIALKSQDVVYHLEQTGSGDIDMYSILLAVPPHKCASFDRVLTSTDTIRAEDYGRVLYYGAGALTQRAISEILAPFN